MNRSTFYDQSQDRTFDDLWAQRHALYAIGQLTNDLLGSTATIVTGLGATQTTSPSMTINLAAGDLYMLAAVDSTAYGSLSADSDLTMQQGFAAAQTVLLSTAGISSGQSRYTLIQATFSQTDDIPGDDPTGGLLNYLNASDPNNPYAAVWSGPNNSGATQNTRRKGVCVISTVNGAPATTGAEVPPNPAGGAVPLYLVDLAFGQSTVTNAEILIAGPSAGTGVPSNYTPAPFLAGLTQKATMQVHAGNPNGAVAGLAAGALFSGSPPTTCWDTTNHQLWMCLTSGPIATALWVVAVQGIGGFQVFATPGTYTYTPSSNNVRAVLVEVQAGGGGGGSVPNITTGQNATGVSGGGGAYLRKFLSSGFSGATVVVGAGGAGGVGASTGDGLAGGTSSFAGTYSCTGGGGGPHTGSTTSWPASTTTAAGGVPSSGDLNIGGACSQTSVMLSLNVAWAGVAGASVLGQSGLGFAVSSNGSPGTGYGAGGTGAVSFAAGAFNGGAGAGGVVNIWEFH